MVINLTVPCASSCRVIDAIGDEESWQGRTPRKPCKKAIWALRSGMRRLQTYASYGLGLLWVLALSCLFSVATAVAGVKALLGV